MLRHCMLVLCLCAWMTARTPLSGRDLIFLLPAAQSAVTVVDAADLSTVGTIPATLATMEVLGTPAGEKYYVISRSASDAVLSVDPETLQVIRRISFDRIVTNAVLTPDGRHLLLTAGTLRILRTRGEEEVVAQVDVGGNLLQLLVNHDSTRAYVLAEGGNLINVVDLNDFTVSTTIEVNDARAIALTESEDRLAVALDDEVIQFRTSDHQEIDRIPTEVEISNGAKMYPVGSSASVFLQNRGSPPRGTSLVFDLINRTVKPVGTLGTTVLQEVVVVDEKLAFGILTSGSQLVEIDLAATPSATVTPLDVDVSARSLSVSPDLETLVLSSSLDNSVSTVDIATRTLTNTAAAPLPPADHSIVFAPSSKPPARVTINSGNNQFLPPGITAPEALSVKITDEDGVPLFDVPVLFSAQNPGVGFAPSQLAMTNSRGIATVIATIPPVEQGSSQEQDITRPIVITAATVDGLSADFTLSTILTTGIVKVSGDFQVTEPREAFPEPFLVLATDETGQPLPAGTTVQFNPFAATCGSRDILTDRNGFASRTCDALELNPGAGTTRDGSVSVTVPARPDLGVAHFTTTTAIASRFAILEKVSGDGQTARTGTALPEPLVFEIKSPTGATLGSNGVGIRIRQIEGPAALIDPPFAVARLGFPIPVAVTLGPKAGTVRIEARASSPSLPTVEFTVEAEGGALARFEIEGDRQSARISRFLPAPLRMRVFDEFGQKIPFPSVSWMVSEGNASLLTASDADGALAYLQFGLTPGPVAVEATIEGLRAEFHLTAVPPQAISVTPIQGEGQTLQVGDVSQPLLVRVLETGNEPAFGGLVTFSAPEGSVLFHPLGGGEPANPLVQVVDRNGLTGVTVELLGIPPPEDEGSSGATQSARGITITAASGQLFTTFLIDVLGRTPVFTAENVGNAASLAQGLVPGSLAALFGAGLSEGVTGTEVAGGDTIFRGTSVTVGGFAAPLLSITRGEMEQINFQVPFEVAPGVTATVEVENNGSSTTVAEIPVFASQPGIFEVPIAEGQAVAAVVHASTFELVTPENPGSKEETFALFFTGGGLTDPPAETGVAGPMPPALMALPVVLEVDGKEAEIVFSGYAPELLGLYQVNFMIPEESGCGVKPLKISVAGAVSPESSIAVRCPEGEAP